MKTIELKDFVATAQALRKVHDNDDDLKKAIGAVLKQGEEEIPVVNENGDPVEISEIILVGAESEEPAEEPAELTQESVEAAAEKAVAKLLKVEKTIGKRPTEPKKDDKPTIPVQAKRWGGTIKSFAGPDAEVKAFGFGTWAHWLWTGDRKSGQWLRDNGVITKAQYESANTAGGATVPDDFVADLIRLVEEFGVFRRNARVVPMSRETATFPRRTGGLTANFIGEATSDSATGITKSSMTFNNVKLVAKKLAALTLVSPELMEDAAISIGDLLATELALAFSEKEDDCGFNGDGTSTYGGIEGVLNAVGAGSTVTAASGNTAFATLDREDFIKCIATIPEYARRNAKWYISSAGFADSMERLAHAAGGNTVSDEQGGVQLRYLGYPVEITQKLNSTLTAQTSTKLVVFGDLSMGAMFGDRRSLDVKTSEDRYFDTDQIAVRGIERFDINVHDAGDADTAGPIVVLETPS